MAEVMASAQEAANSAVTNENEARAVVAIELNVPGKIQHNAIKFISTSIYIAHRGEKIVGPN